MTESRLLYRSRRSPALWGLLVASLAPVALAAWLLTLPSQARLLQDLGSATGVFAWKAVLLLVSSALAWPMLWLSGRYVTEVRQVGAQRLQVQVWTVFGPRRREWTGAFGEAAAHEGRHAVPGAAPVDAPWTGYRTPAGQRLVIDARGDFPQGETALAAALAGAE